MKSYLYTRISTLQQAKGFGIERQIKTVTDFLEYAVLDSRLGYQLDPNDYEVLGSDIGRSAFKGQNWKSTSSLGRFYDDVLKGRITSAVLLCENVDRLTRLSNYEASNKLTDLITRGIDIIEVESGSCFSNKIPESSTLLNMSINRAYTESKRKSSMATKSWSERKRKLIESGTAISAKCPRWLSVVNGMYIVDEGLAETLLYIHKMYSQGHGNSALVRRLNDSGRLDNGNLWSTVTIHRVLRDERLTGRMIMGKNRKPVPVLDSKGNPVIENGKVKTHIPVEIIDDAYPVIVDRELFDTVQNMISDKKGAKVKKTTKYMRNIFNGISRCFKCGSALIAEKNGHGKLFYTCLSRRHQKTCTSIAIPYVVVEGLVLENLSQLDWQRIYTGATDMEAMNQCRLKLVQIEKEISELEEELIDSDDSLVLVLVRAIKNKKIIQKELMEELNNYLKAGKDNVEFRLDRKVLDQSNVSLRQDVNVELRKIIREIKFGRDGNIVMVAVQYFSDVLSHLFILDIKLNAVLSTSHLSNELVYESKNITINLLTGERDFDSTKITDWDIEALKIWNQIVQEGAKIALKMISD